MFKIHTQARQGNLPWMTSDDMHLQALANMAADYPLLHHIDNASLVESTWHHLKPFAGAPEAMMVAAHEGDLAAARTAGEGFEEPEVSNFDIEARNFDGLCRKLGV